MMPIKKRAKNCPLKSTDEIIAEIYELKSTLIKHGYNGLALDAYSELTKEIIHKYCDKENKDDWKDSIVRNCLNSFIFYV